jgi:hypothetical protein
MREVKCEYCGNVFFITGSASTYVYKRKKKKDKQFYFFCSYSCLSKAEKENQEAYNRKKYEKI